MRLSAAIQRSGRNITVVGGRYGLSSKEFTPPMVKAVFDELGKPEPRHGFTVGINDDVTHMSLDYDDSFKLSTSGVVECKFYGMGADGTVGATKQAARIISEASNLYSQAYFNYSAKKSGGYTISQLRFGKKPIRSEYAIRNADYVCCNKATYVHRFDMLNDIRPGGTFVLNSP